MKLIILILGICVLGMVKGESCTTDTSPCRHTTCDSTSELHCVDGKCTCTVKTDRACTALSECLALTNWNCDSNRRHCIDELCRCTRF